MKEEIFKDVLIRERKRADRSRALLGLLLVTASKDAPVDSSTWDAAISAIGAAKRETDVLGWFRAGSSLGVILTDIRCTDRAIARLLEARIRRELLRGHSAEKTARFSIQLYPYPKPQAETAVGPMDLLFENAGAPAKQASLYTTIKRGVDAIGSFVLLAGLSPFLLLIAALIKLTSPGPVLFRQTRVGQNATKFGMLKFRTMYVNADHSIHKAFVTKLINDSPADREPGVFKIVNDPRVTRIGRFLRKTSLDELPQFWNVLRGEMSMVGPRPPLPYEVEQYKHWHLRRILEAKPGITGLWQVTGRSRTTFDDMVRLDIRYAKTRSLWTDVKILLATPAAVVVGKGAC
jgi:lipopolysaccharide/colanic/teichoic acid biosynthesis glycosyltransferase